MFIALHSLRGKWFKFLSRASQEGRPSDEGRMKGRLSPRRPGRLGLHALREVYARRVKRLHFTD